jgi:iron complex outermembrane receptor protein
MLIRLRFIAAVLFVVPAFAGTNNTIVVSAPRLDDLDLMAVDTAADVTVIDRGTIESSGAVSVPELLQNEANVLIRSTSGNNTDGQISMRGFGDNSHLRTLVLVDGHKANRPDMAGIEWQDIPVGNIERIEVIRGGQNVLYGNHALSGVVKITTRRGDDSGFRLDGKMGSFGYLAGSAGYSGRVGDVDYYVGINSYSYDGFRSNSLSRASSVHGSASWYMNDTDTLTLRSSYSDSHRQFPGPLTYEQLKDDPTQSPTNAVGDASDDHSGLATLLYETERDWGAARASTGINLRERDTSLGGIEQHIDLIGVSFGPRIRLGSRDTFFMAGVDLNYDALNLDQYLDASRDIVKAWAEIDRITVSPYVFAQRTLNEKTVLNGGARFEYAGTDNRYVEYVENQLRPTTNRGTPNPNYKNPADVNPAASFDGIVEKHGWATEVSVSRELTEALTVWTGYDRVYRYPTFDETAAYQGFDLADPLNEKLDPETGNNFELGSKYTGQGWSASLTGFYLMLDNEIVFDDVAKLNRNIGNTRRVGAEAEVAWDRGWYGASTRWAFVDARLHGGENDGNHVPLIPWAYGVSRFWINPVEEMRMMVTYTYVSEQFQGNDEENALPRKIDPYGLLGLRVNIAMADYADVYFSVHNLLDETYATTAYSGGFYPGSGRSFQAGLTLEF